jgi:hypothetical protein
MRGLMRHVQLNFHPLENTATTTIASADLLKVPAPYRSRAAIVQVCARDNGVTQKAWKGGRGFAT